MGMMFDVTQLGEVWVFGLVISLVAMAAKIFGSGLPALALGFNRKGAWRIGVGMVPRGEVALIMGGIAVGHGIIEADLFGASIIMTIVTTVIAPLVLLRSYRSGGSGSRKDDQQAQTEDAQAQQPASEVSE